MWLAAENGMFLRSTRGDWMTTMPEHSNMEWVDSVKVRGIHAFRGLCPSHVVFRFRNL